jgi:hypothetical protein
MAGELLIGWLRVRILLPAAAKRTGAGVASPGYCKGFKVWATAYLYLPTVQTGLVVALLHKHSQSVTAVPLFHVP